VRLQRPKHHRAVTAAGIAVLALVPALLALALGVGCGKSTEALPTGPGAPASGTSPAPTDAEVVSFVQQMNAHRVSLGLQPLLWHPGVAAVAEAHSRDMIDRGFFSHTNPDGESPWDRLHAAGITYTNAGENIAYGYSTGTSVLNAWLNSPGHKANIEYAAFTHHGVGKVGSHWTHVFIRPTTSSVASR
jgi:uncharacterized protein YkwD